MEPESKIKNNTFVRHVLGGPTMWVEGVRKDGLGNKKYFVVTCVWFDKMEGLNRSKFFDTELEETVKPYVFNFPTTGPFTPPNPFLSILPNPITTTPSPLPPPDVPYQNPYGVMTNVTVPAMCQADGHSDEIV